MQPLDPLRAARPDQSIDVVVPFVLKDLDNVYFCLRGVITTVRNPIERIRLITPDYKTEENKRLIEQQIRRTKAESPRTPVIQVEQDDHVLGEPFFRELDERGIEHPGGWKLQQMIKLYASHGSRAFATLVVDADTVLLEPRTWVLADGTQLLQFSESFQPGYKRHFREYFGEGKIAPFSFVTHHQLLRTDVLQEMFPHLSNIIDWYESSLEIPGPSLSEYEAYGSYLWARHRDEVRLGAWANLWSPRKAELGEELRNTRRTIAQLIPDYCSVSFHAHSQLNG